MEVSDNLSAANLVMSEIKTIEATPSSDATAKNLTSTFVRANEHRRKTMISEAFHFLLPRLQQEILVEGERTEKTLSITRGVFVVAFLSYEEVIKLAHPHAFQDLDDLQVPLNFVPRTKAKCALGETYWTPPLETLLAEYKPKHSFLVHMVCPYELINEVEEGVEPACCMETIQMPFLSLSLTSNFPQVNQDNAPHDTSHELRNQQHSQLTKQQEALPATTDTRSSVSLQQPLVNDVPMSGDGTRDIDDIDGYIC